MITFLTQPSELIVVGLRPDLSVLIALQSSSEDLSIGAHQIRTCASSPPLSQDLADLHRELFDVIGLLDETVAALL